MEVKDIGRMGKEYKGRLGRIERLGIGMSNGRCVWGIMTEDRRRHEK